MQQYRDPSYYGLVPDFDEDGAAGYDWYYWNCPTATDYLVYAAWQVLKNGGWGQMRAFLEPLTQLVADSAAIVITPLPVVAAPPPASREQLEARLAHHLQLLTNQAGILNQLPATIHPVVHQAEDFAQLQGIAASEEGQQVVLRLLMFAPFWIRPLHSWLPQGADERSKLFSLLDHLLIQYPVPPFLYAEWLTPLEIGRIKWIGWFILLGAGRSLHRAALTFGWTIARKFQAYFLAAPPDITPTEACMYAEILRLGGSSLEFRRLQRNAGFVIDPTEISAQPSYLTFWQETVIWLSRNRNVMSDEEVDLILAWAMHQYTEAERAAARPFLWRGRSARRALEAAREYRRQVERPFTAYVWQRHGWDWRYSDEAARTWSFVELTTGQELFHEGQALHHCVASYTARCAAGYSAIISLRHEEVRRITIEINPYIKQIVQARGLQNRLPTAQEQTVINQWVKEVLSKPADPTAPAI